MLFNDCLHCVVTVYDMYTDPWKGFQEDKVSRAIHNYANDIKEVDVTLSVAGGDRGPGAKQQKTDITIYTLRNGVVSIG